MIVKRTQFHKYGVNLNVVTKKIKNGFLVSAQDKEDVYKENEEDALNIHEDYVGEIILELESDLQERISSTMERLENLKEVNSNFNSLVAEAKKGAKEDYKRYQERQKEINN